MTIESQTYLLDANVLIALVVHEHEHHQRAAAWVARLRSIALCPIVEGALVRFLVRAGEAPGAGPAVLTALHASPRCAFWPDEISYATANLAHVTGHRQVTDAYLVSLADHHGARLATFDTGLAHTWPGTAELVP